MSRAETPHLGVLVLAAGKSTRIRSISGDTPKPLLQVVGQSILARNLRWLASSGLSSVWVNLHYQPEQIQAALGTGESLGLTIQYSLEPEILGTAGAYKNLEPHWQGTVLVVYGDSLVRFDLDQFLAAHRQAGAIATIALFDQTTHANTAIAGGRVVLNSQGRVTEFIELRGQESTVSPLVNAGVYLLEPEALSYIPPDSFYDFGHDLFPRLLQANCPIQGHLIDGYCLGLDTPESFARAMTLIESGDVQLQ